MSAEDEEKFQSRYKCSICNKLFDIADYKVGDHCHITRKYRGSAHKNWNVNLGLTKKTHVIFYDLRGYDSHLIMQEIGNFDVKVNVILTGLEKYMALTIIKNFLF